jgi:hypothetical protein
VDVGVEAQPHGGHLHGLVPDVLADGGPLGPDRLPQLGDLLGDHRPPFVGAGHRAEQAGGAAQLAQHRRGHLVDAQVWAQGEHQPHGGGGHPDRLLAGPDGVTAEGDGLEVVEALHDERVALVWADRQRLAQHRGQRQRAGGEAAVVDRRVRGGGGQRIVHGHLSSVVVMDTARVCPG